MPHGGGLQFCVAVNPVCPFKQHNFLCISAAAAAKSLQSCLTLCDPIDGSPPESRPWDSPGKNTGVGCHFLLQCMKVKSESEVSQSCPTLCDPMDCSPPGFSIHGIFQARVLEWGAIAFSAMYIYNYVKKKKRMGHTEEICTKRNQILKSSKRVEMVSRSS